jgi:hypothetical protein
MTDDQGGDPACWLGLVADHRDDPPDSPTAEAPDEDGENGSDAAEPGVADEPVPRPPGHR